MTDLMERIATLPVQAVPHLTVTGEECTAENHWTAWSYHQLGCRSAEAVAEYHAERTRRAAARRDVRRGGDGRRYRATKEIALPDPACPAPAHFASAVGWDAGCVCPGAVYARERRLSSMRHAQQERRRAAADPREWWLRPDMRCGRTDLWWLMQGEPRTDLITGQACNTQIERMVAVMRLTGRRHPSGVPWSDTEIAQYLGVSHATVYVVRRLPAKFRAKRTARRLAESKWRAMRNERLGRG